MVFVIQERSEDPKRYVATRPTKEEAESLVKDIESFDMELDEYVPHRYVISKHGYCYNQFAAVCGWCTNGICMMMAPDINCSLARMRALQQSKGESRI